MEILSYMGLLLLAGAAISVHVWGDWADSTKMSTASMAAADIAKTAESVWSHGPGSKKTITVRIPPDVIHGWAKDNRIIYRILLSSGSTDILETVDAPIRGTLPTQQGIHQLTIEYGYSGFVRVGGCLYIYPESIEKTLSSEESFSSVFYLTNLCPDDISDAELSVFGGPQGWALTNQTKIGVFAGNSTPFTFELTVPHDAGAGVRDFFISAESGPAYAESMVFVTVNSSFCGDGVLDESEQCEARAPGGLPDHSSPQCPSTVRLVCDESNARYLWSQPYGTCTLECICADPEPVWKVCSTGCNDPIYCAACDHCADGVRNCAETSVDSGAACPVCDGNDDLAQGFECSLGQTRSCGGPGCEGTMTCERTGSSCAWSDCTSYWRRCGQKCCVCSGDPKNPTALFDGSRHGDCPGSVSICDDPSSCAGISTGLICSSINECSKDTYGEFHNISDDPSACMGMECAPETAICHEQSYPCMGERTISVCDSKGGCIPTTFRDDTVCSGIAACQAPKEIILHKMDFGGRNYVDAPSSLWGGMGRLYYGNCETDSAYYTIRGMHIRREGAYRPYQNGTLNFYARASVFVDDGSRRILDCPWYCGCDLRLGTDENNWVEWDIRCPPSHYWTKLSLDLKSEPIDSMGEVDWDNIDYLRFRFGAMLIVCFQCQACYGNIDYVTLQR